MSGVGGREVRQRRAAVGKTLEACWKGTSKRLQCVDGEEKEKKKRAPRQSSEGWKEMCVPTFSLQKGTQWTRNVLTHLGDWGRLAGEVA